MKTDRELLGLAAKAAGVTIRYNSIGTQDARCVWNPLEDDGDALRLAVKLNLWNAVRMAHRLLGADGCPDMYAATRRAIVRAAADIGEAMP